VTLPSSAAAIDPSGDNGARRLRGISARVREPELRRAVETAAPALILVVAAAARLSALGHAETLVFDETFYVKDGWSTWQLGYEGEWIEGSDERFQAGDPGGLTTEADYVVHPPLGKWIIGMAMAVFGMADPFWWRLPSALAGIALVGLTYAIARGLLKSVAFASIAGFLVAIDGLAIVMSRTALLDGILAMFVLAGAGALLLDRRGSAARSVRALAARPDRLGAALCNRPWIVFAGALLGAACATKWSGAAFLAAFGLWIVAMDALDRRRAGFSSPWLGTLVTQAPTSFMLLCGPALLVYVVSYAGWFDGGWGSQLMLERADLRWGGLLAWVPLGLQSLWQYHVQQFTFHVGLDDFHRYSSPAYEWLWLGEPTPFVSRLVDDHVASIVAEPNRLVWFAAVAALGLLVWRWARTGDRTAGFIVVGVAAGYVPWLLFPERTIYFFYAIVFLPFLVIGLAYALQLLTSRPARAAVGSPAPTGSGQAPRRPLVSAGFRHRLAVIAMVLLLTLSVLVAAKYMPLWYGIPM
jgi:dolichyl-phosphate-mannose-protein mannosyltransferase